MVAEGVSALHISLESTDTASFEFDGITHTVKRKGQGPIYAAARVAINHGVPPHWGVVITRDGKVAMITKATIGHLAKFTLKDTDRGLKLSRYESLPLTPSPKVAASAASAA